MLAWRRSVKDRWNFSHARQLLVASATNPLLPREAAADKAVHPLNRFGLVEQVEATRPDDVSWWLLELRDGRNDAPFVSLDPDLMEMAVYPVAIVRSLGRAERPSRKPSKKSRPVDAEEWPWRRIGVETAKVGTRQVRLAILDDGYFRDPAYACFVATEARQNRLGGPSLQTLDEDSHGAACLLYASEVVLRSAGASEVVTLVPYRVFESDACATEKLLIETLRDIAINDIDIVVAPWLLRQENAALEHEIETLGKAGILFITGVANARLDLDHCPCAQQMAYWAPCNIGVVGAIGRRRDHWPLAFGQTRVDIGAPGQDLFNRLTGRNDDSGSSFAAPIAAAVVAVELSRRAERVTAVDVWSEVLGSASPCQACHPRDPHCLSQGIVHFPG